MHNILKIIKKERHLKKETPLFITIKYDRDPDLDILVREQLSLVRVKCIANELWR